MSVTAEIINDGEFPRSYVISPSVNDISSPNECIYLDVTLSRSQWQDLIAVLTNPRVRSAISASSAELPESALNLICAKAAIREAIKRGAGD